jgi:CRP/FNR family transcriptional regulator
LIEEIAFGRIDRRLADLLITKFDNDGVPLTSIAATHDSVAAELGTAREVVSRALKKFESSGAILLSRGKIQLTNESILKSLAEMI